MSWRLCSRICCFSVTTVPVGWAAWPSWMAIERTVAKLKQKATATTCDYITEGKRVLQLHDMGMWGASDLPVLQRWPSATAAAPPTGSGPRCGRSPWASPGTCSGDAAWSCAGCADRGHCSPAGSGCTAGLFPPGGCGIPVWHGTLCWQRKPLLKGRLMVLFFVLFFLKKRLVPMTRHQIHVRSL